MLSNLTPAPDDFAHLPPGRVVAPTPADLRAAATLVLGVADDPDAAHAEIDRLLDYLSGHGVDALHTRIVVDADNRPTFAALPVPSPGGICLLLCPNHLGGATPADAASAVREAVESTVAADACVQLVQALRPVEDDPLAPALTQLGFFPLADLIYMARRVHRPPRESETRPPAGLRVVNYSPDTHDLFARALDRSYDGSLDSPEMRLLQTTEQTLVGHRAVGEFHADWWEVLVDDGPEPLGLLILAGVPGGGGTELVYLGLSPAARGRGLGGLLLRRALAVAAGSAGRTITLAVDARNVPALTLYERNNFRKVDARRAFFWRVRGGSVR